jgi:hypothetical protein
MERVDWDPKYKHCLDKYIDERPAFLAMWHKRDGKRFYIIEEHDAPEYLFNRLYEMGLPVKAHNHGVTIMLDLIRTGGPCT